MEREKNKFCGSWGRVCLFLHQSIVVACGDVGSTDTVIHEIDSLQLFVDAA